MLRVPDGDRLSRTQLDGLTDFAKSYGVKGIAYVRVKDDLSWQGLHIGDKQGSDLMSGAPIAVGKNHLDELFPARARHPDLGRVDSSGR